MRKEEDLWEEQELAVEAEEDHSVVIPTAG